MEIQVITGDIKNIKSDAAVICQFEDSGELDNDKAVLDQALDGVISRLISSGEIKGKYKESTVIYTLGKLDFPKLVILGLGKKAELNCEKVRVSIAEVIRSLRSKNAEVISLEGDGFAAGGIGLESIGQAIAEGAVLGSYTFRKHLTREPDHKDIKLVNIIIASKPESEVMERGCRKGIILAEAANLARDMGNEPANVMTPTALAGIAMEIARNNNLKANIIDQDEMKTLGMGGLLGVSQGSAQPPKLIELTYKGRKSDEIDIALIGKGITFDSGGISIKPSDNMGEMKGDMAGGASVISAMKAIACLKPEINVTAIVPATENLPSGIAMRPGDIIRIMNGKTVEIISTDAEGRLILADAISYARKMGAKRIVDVATLTGACHIALGDYCTGTFGNNQDLINQVIAAGAEAGECMWQLPMNEEYREQNKSDVADIKNTGGRYGGAITAAWFLREFVDMVPWVHLDIAGTSTTDRDRGYLVKGNTGIPVRTLVNLVLSLAK